MIFSGAVRVKRNPRHPSRSEEAVPPYEREVAAGDRCQYDQVHVMVVGDEAPDRFVDVECLELPDGDT